MSYEIRILQLAPTPTAVVRRRARPGELSEVVPNACGLVWRVLRARSVPGAGRHIALYLDSEINLEIGVELDTAAPFVSDGEVVRSVIPGGTVATVVHVGPYHRLHEAHEAISRWCEDHRCALAGPSWEIYGHWHDDQEPRTDVFYLLENPVAPVHGSGG